VRTDNREVRHPNLVFRALLDQAEALDAPLVARIPAPGVVQETPVDLVDDLQMPRQHLLKIVERPFFEGFGQ